MYSNGTKVIVKQLSDNIEAELMMRKDKEHTESIRRMLLISTTILIKKTAVSNQVIL